MTTTTITGFAFETDNTDTVVDVTTTVELQIVDDEGAGFSYTVDSAPADDLPEVTVTEDAYHITIDGVESDADGIFLGTVSWGSGNKTQVVAVDIETGSGTTTYIFALGGDPLPAINTVSDFNDLENSITGFSTADSPYAPGDMIAWTDIPTGVSVENDQITGGGGANDLSGGKGDDTISGNGGSDTLKGGSGNDGLSGGKGDDVLNPGDNAGGANGFDVVEGGLGNDTINFGQIAKGWVAVSHNDLSAAGQSITVDIDGAANTGTITSSNGQVDTLNDVENPLNSGWTTGGLRINGTTGNDTFNIHTAKTQWIDLLGGDGDDTFNVSGKGLARLSYHSSNGAVNADLKAGTITQDGNTDTVNGNVWEVRGGNGNDTLKGSGSNESFIGQGGDNMINGRGGFDTVRYDRGGNDSGVTVDLGAGTATGTWNGTAFTDTLNNIERVRGSDFKDKLIGDSGNNRLDGNAGNDTLKGGGGGDKLFGGGGRDKLIGQGGNDKLFGQGGNDVLKGGGGKDVLKGGGGNDRLLGNAGDDKLLGQKGKDKLIGGGGNDTLAGGGGADTFIFNGNKATGDDVITDFQNGTDLIKITGAVDFGDLTITQAGGDTVVSWDNGSVTLDGVTGTIDANDFVF